MTISADQRRRQILDAAVRVFARSGYAGCRVADVAEEAGVAYGLVYHYFSSKEQLLGAISADAWQEVAAAVARAREREATARGRLSYVTHFLLAASERQPDLVRVLIREVARSPHLERQSAEVECVFDAIAAVIAAGQEAGELRRDVDPAVAAVVYFGAVDELLTRIVSGSQVVSAESAEHAVVAIIGDGLAR